ncbi:hypothetical protein A2Z67_05885 [Candidatus Woesebacteria bacterium RBG_13_36_22]|uniref:Transcobalamin-like C-terminal domain-containing protein n=1 Tax=Candidatus Woesebacteria bacterium RBG_13_36_22 TaxID=1802478 RepID=A0A1F7X204_9BACT|nr:MAG: hypothetical protein A2Z67_05885 [Candidatus Woesebacteria bacterium RBG_13_36_22]
MDKAKTLLITILIIFLGFVVIGLTFFAKFRPPPSTTITPSPSQESAADLSQNRVYLKVIFADGNEISYEKELNPEGSLSTFDLLKEALDNNQVPYETKSYDFGIFVKSINGFESGADKSWIYFVNGQGGQIAADQYKLKAKDVVEWKYITPTQ